jgi:acyl-ACP thioesterase
VNAPRELRQTIHIPSYLCGPDDRLGVDGIASIFQEAAWKHAAQHAVAFTGANSSLYWVLHRLGMHVVRAPEWGETISLRTWPSRMERLFALREFEVADESGSVVIHAATSWLIMDGSRGRPVRPEAHISPDWATPDVSLPLPTGKLSVIDPDEVVARLTAATWDTVRPSDTDRNAHVNNARYAQWFRDHAPEILGSLPHGALSFTNETRAGQQYCVISDQAQGIAEVWVRDPGREADTAVCACRYNCL